MQPFDTVLFIVRHPLGSRRPISSVGRYVRWQVESRLRKEIAHRWIAGSILLARRGMTGASGNIYVGLHEFADMAFLLHFLRPSDLFLDVGANIGSYTILASNVCGARTIAFEPDPHTCEILERNIAANGVGALVSVQRAAVGAGEGEIQFTAGLDTVNRVATEGDMHVQAVKLMRLDSAPGAERAAMAKLDVEGFESEALRGAPGLLASKSLIAIETESRDAEVMRILSNAGFERVVYEPFSRALRVFWWVILVGFYSSGRPTVRIFRARYSSSRRPKARRWMVRILLLKPSTKPSGTLWVGWL